MSKKLQLILKAITNDRLEEAFKQINDPSFSMASELVEESHEFKADIPIYRNVWGKELLGKRMPLWK